MRPAALAYHRFGYGPRPGDLSASTDPVALLEAELADPANAALDALQPSAAIFSAIREEQKERQAARAQKASMAASADGQPAMDAEHGSKAAQMPSAARAAYIAEVQARIDKALAAPVGFVERLSAFWSNHFAVQVRKDQIVRGLAGAFEREAIRPHVNGRFADMLLAVTQHPAMLRSLDNVVSVGPDSRFGLTKSRGLNENHARELMELHTVGVDGGYHQSDVVSLARVLTGWTIDGGAQTATPGAFVFRAAWHEPGPQTVMGRVYAAGGIEQGEQALHDLAANPATARHIAGKLALAFVSDDPDPGLVDRLAKTFSDTGGDLGAVNRALIHDDAAWEKPGAKLKSPQEYLVGAARGLDLAVPAQLAVRSLNDLGQAPWDPPSPAGFPLDSESWLAPAAINTRIELAERIAAIDKSKIDPRSLGGDLLGDDASPDTRQAIARAESRQQAVALLLMSPEFQRR